MYLSDDKMREFYRQNEEAYWRGVLATAKAEGIAEGKAEGKAEERIFWKPLAQCLAKAWIALRCSTSPN